MSQNRIFDVLSGAALAGGAAAIWHYSQKKAGTAKTTSGNAKTTSGNAKTTSAGPQLRKMPPCSSVHTAGGFAGSFPGLVSGFVDHMEKVYQLEAKDVKRLTWMLEYNCQGGKCYRATLVMNSTKAVCEKFNLPFSEFEPYAMVLGWCVEILQACFLVADDIMDQSLTRRGKPCWYKQETIQYDAVNDALILESFVFWCITNTFQGMGDQILLQLYDLFHVTMRDTEIGQMLDLTSQPLGRSGKDVLNNFTLDKYLQIVTNKTAHYTFFLPVACGLTLVRSDWPKDVWAMAREITTELGVKFQIQDDYLDNYGLPEVIGKVGTDIQDHKCSWLCVQALRLMSPQQRETFELNYGKEDEASVQIIKKIFNDLELEALYLKQEEESYKKLVQNIADASSVLPPALFEPILKKIHLRKK